MKFKFVFALLAVTAMLVGAVTAGAANTATLFGATGASSSPSTLAIDSSGNIFTANSNSTISRITSSGTVDNSWATGVLPSLTSIATGPSGSVFVSSDTGNDGYKVQKYASSGGAPAAETSTGSIYDRPRVITVDSAGTVYFFISSSPNKLGKIPSGGSAVTSNLGYQAAGGLITDSAGNLYVTDSTSNKVHKYDTSFTEVTSGGWPVDVGLFPGNMAVDSTYLYVAYRGTIFGGISRVKLSDASVTSAWATPLSGLSGSSPIAIDSTGKIYVGAGSGPTKSIFSISTSGAVTTLTTLDFQPQGLVVDSSGNVYTANLGNGFPLMTAGVYKITVAAPTPTPTPTPSSNSSSATTTTTTTGKPAPGPALKVTDIPAEITLDLGSSTGGTIPAEQPIIAEVPCTAPEGQLLDRCTVNVTAPEYVLLGQGDGISVRAGKKISIGKATVKAKSGKKVIVVKVTINGKGRKALQRNLKITATVGLTAITVSNLKSSGEANTEMRLPTQLISPQAGIFDSNSITLNKAGVAFVNRLALLLPKAPKQMTFIGFADNTGVPGDNRWLGDRRAKAVHDALEAKGITAAKSSIETKAATSPRADNAKASGRERNRRVSIRITY